MSCPQIRPRERSPGRRQARSEHGPRTSWPISTKGEIVGEHFHGLRPVLRRLRREDRGASTAEYAVTTMAAVGFAGALLMLLRGDEVRSVLADLVRRALTVDG